MKYLINGVEYHIHFYTETKPLIGCIITWKNGKKFEFTSGAAVCHPGDEYDEKVGRKLAMKRALRLESYFPPKFGAEVAKIIWHNYREGLMVEASNV